MYTELKKNTKSVVVVVSYFIMLVISHIHTHSLYQFKTTEFQTLHIGLKSLHKVSDLIKTGIYILTARGRDFLAQDLIFCSVHLFTLGQVVGLYIYIYIYIYSLNMMS